jgi:hypothetical protein
MKFTLSFFIFTFAVITSFVGFSQAKSKADKDTKNWRYEIEGVGEGKEGTYLVKVWTYSKKPKIAIEQAKKNAVHGVVFQQVVGSGKVSTKPALVSDPGVEISKADFFDPFFEDNGEYMKYVSLSNDGSIAPEDRLKVGKEYKIGVIVSVRKDALKEALIKAGVIKSLNSGF